MIALQQSLNYPLTTKAMVLVIGALLRLGRELDSALPSILHQLHVLQNCNHLGVSKGARIRVAQLVGNILDRVRLAVLENTPEGTNLVLAHFDSFFDKFNVAIAFGRRIPLGRGQVLGNLLDTLVRQTKRVLSTGSSSGNEAIGLKLLEWLVEAFRSRVFVAHGEANVSFVHLGDLHGMLLAHVTKNGILLGFKG